MDPITRLEASIAQARPVIAGAPLSSYGDPTPCTDWDVRGLINHMLGALTMFFDVATQGEVDPTLFTRDLVGDDAVAAYDAIGAEVVAAWRVKGLDGNAVLPFGEFPAMFALQLPAMDQVIHAWDLATATGQQVAWDDALVAETAAFCQATFADPAMRGHDFGPSVEVPDGASAIDRLAGYLGRTPLGAAV
ncbi:TIGR03086 family protein [Nocardioides humilatus]|uniref:TIGR03086 family protein n=1 Tax=Nocardioides humilatus TaxID=2607660 RepID=A0A5B1L5M1_9ACTN|nr:TIGR03086 family metal-binding protein [Nocardioides humilatus]KAA1415981.1 TIGR03086 family protein [Nocardioides humilatus]